MLDIAPMMGVLEGVVMELQDCALPLLVDVQAFCEEDKVIVVKETELGTVDLNTA